METSEEVRVLVVDDVPDTADMLALVLEMDGYNARAVHSGEEALRLVDEFAPLCVLVDIHMPGLSGHELTHRLRSRYGDEIVLVAVTGAGLAEDRISDQFAQFDHYLRKPVDLGLLKKLLPPLEAGSRSNAA